MPLKGIYEGRLREAYTRVALTQQWANPRRAIRLSSSFHLDEDPAGGVRLTLGADAVVANMQIDKAAFESWALALHLWCQEQRVVLDWEVPTSENGHYQRFLYRVDQARRLFPNWLFVADGAKLLHSRVLHPTAPLLLNSASRARDITAEETLRLLPEAKLEAELVANPSFAARFGLERLDRQFPVGLFQGAVAKDCAVFTGGKSAIDIVGVGDSGFWLFELKAGANAPIGALSELLFYTSLIRDAASANPRFRFSAGLAGTVIRASDVEQARAINAVLLLQARHPLLDHPELIATLNAAAASTWNLAAGAVPVIFHMAAV